MIRAIIVVEGPDTLPPQSYETNVAFVLSTIALQVYNTGTQLPHAGCSPGYIEK